MVAIDLKIGEFQATYKWQIELYLCYLEIYELINSENFPIQLILCAEKNERHIELLQLEKSNIQVVEYLALLPPQKLFQKSYLKNLKLLNKNI